MKKQNKIRFWGTRGSLPVSGKKYARYGGNTSCLEIRCADDLIIIDAGSGIRAPSEKWLAEGRKTYHILFSHTHWDHLIGLPFFAPLNDPHCTVHLYGPAPLEKLLSQQFSAPFFPIALINFKAKIVYHILTPGSALKIGAITIHSALACHLGKTLCFTFTLNKICIGYATDNELFLEEKVQKELTTFFAKCTHIIHEAQYSATEYQSRIGWGHSSLPNLAAFINLLPKQISWLITHHDPKNSDTLLEKRLLSIKKLAPQRKIKLAYDGLTLNV